MSFCQTRGGGFAETFRDENTEYGCALKEGGGEGCLSTLVGEGIVEGDLVGAGRHGGGEAKAGAHVHNVAAGEVGLDLKAGCAVRDSESEEVHGGGWLEDGLEGAILGIGDEDHFRGGDDILVGVSISENYDVGIDG